jgi:hypothetical protein
MGKFSIPDTGGPILQQKCDFGLRYRELPSIKAESLMLSSDRKLKVRKRPTIPNNVTTPGRATHFPVTSL